MRAITVLGSELFLVPLAAIVPPGIFSFPSGHAMASVAIYGILFAVLTRLHPGFRRWGYLGSILVAALIGGSRVVLGVHRATDVIAGFVAGGAVLALSILALDRRLPA